MVGIVTIDMATPDIYIGEEELRAVSPFRVAGDSDVDASIDVEPGAGSQSSAPRPPTIRINGRDEPAATYLSLRGADPGEPGGTDGAQPVIELNEYSDQEAPAEGLRLHPSQVEMNGADVVGARDVGASSVGAATVSVYERLESGSAVSGPGTSDWTYEPGAVRVMNGEGSGGENYDAVTLRGAPADEQPQGGTVTVYDGNENEAVTLRGSSAELELGFRNSTTSDLFGTIFSGASGTLVLNDGARFGIQAEITAQNGKIEIGTAAWGPLFQIDTRNAKVKTKWPIEETL